MADTKRIEERIAQLEAMLKKITDPELISNITRLVAELKIVLYEHQQMEAEKE